jgi:hypothetical protein
MIIDWIHISGYGPSAWIHDGAPVSILMHHQQNPGKTVVHKSEHANRLATDQPETDAKS